MTLDVLCSSVVVFTRPLAYHPAHGIMMIILVDSHTEMPRGGSVRVPSSILIHVLGRAITVLIRVMIQVAPAATLPVTPHRKLRMSVVLANRQKIL